MSTKSIIQLGLFDNKQPECISVANKWNFPLTPSNHNNQYVYHVLQWIAGMSGYTTDDRAARNAVARMKMNGIFSTNQHFINGDSENPEDIMATAQGLYLIAQNMRSTKNKPQIQEIKDYLAAAGVFVDTARDNPQMVGEKLLEIAEQRRINEIKKYERAGYGDTPQVRHLRARHEGIDAVKELKDIIYRICEKPNYPQFFNAEYMALFGQLASGLKQILGSDSIRDALPERQLAYLRVAELNMQELMRQSGNMTMEQILMIVDRIVRPLGENLREVSEMLGVNHITGQALLEAKG